MKKQFLAITLCLLLVFSLVGCAAASKDMATDNGGAMYAPESAEGDYELNRWEDGSLTDNSASKEEPSLPADRKLIQTVDMSVETENLDIVLGHIDTRVGELNGYIEASNIRNGSMYSGRRYRSADLTVRIPAENLTQFVDHMGEVSNVVSSNKTVDDVTLSYVSIESRMKALQTEETRLLELLAKAESMSDILDIEKRLTQVRSDLEEYTSQLRVFDNQVDYGTVYLTIREVVEFTVVEEPESVWERIGTGFMESLKNLGDFFVELFVFVIVALPYLIPLGLVITGVIFLIRRSNKKKNKNKDA